MQNLTAYIELKRKIKKLEAEAKTLIPEANREFFELPEDVKEIAGAKLSVYTPPKKWLYSDEVYKIEEELKRKKKVEELTKVAKDVTPSCKEDALAFKVSL